MAFSTYLTYTPADLLSRLAEVSTTLTSLYSDIAFTKATELQTKQQAWADSTETSVTGRERVASYHAVNITTDLLELEAKKESLLEEKFFLIRLLEYRTKNDA